MDELFKSKFAFLPLVAFHLLHGGVSHGGVSHGGARGGCGPTQGLTSAQTSTFPPSKVQATTESIMGTPISLQDAL